MGGFGSGNFYRFGAKDRVEDCRSLDVRRWQREGFLEPGRFFGWAWYQDGQEVSSIGVTVLRGVVELSYSWGPEGRKEDVRLPGTPGPDALQLRGFPTVVRVPGRVFGGLGADA